MLKTILGYPTKIFLCLFILRSMKNQNSNYSIWYKRMLGRLRRNAERRITSFSLSDCTSRLVCSWTYSVIKLLNILQVGKIGLADLAIVCNDASLIFVEAEVRGFIVSAISTEDFVVSIVSCFNTSQKKERRKRRTLVLVFCSINSR